MWAIVPMHNNRKAQRTLMFHIHKWSKYRFEYVLSIWNFGALGSPDMQKDVYVKNCSKCGIIKRKKIKK